ncbi:MAG: amino acid ABC transporter permease, partial [Bacillota bacterium]|nr:amino acid ABC transporter permease [Bacillota bacterium]
KYDFGMNIVATDERTESSVLSENYYSCDIVLVVEDVYDDGIGFFESIKNSFEKTFIKENRWKMFVEGTGVTILITLASLAFGTLLGFVVYLACRHGGKVVNGITGFFNWLIAGMPTVVLLMILFYVVFGSSKLSGTWISIIGFTLIFACCMFDMLCVGCGAIPKGQIEASRALGYTDKQSFFKIILPQAARHFLPIYKNDMVSLIKETSIVGYIAVRDLTKISDFVRSRTYEAFFALIATAVIYFVVEGVLSLIISRIQVRIDPKRRPKSKVLDGITEWE